jgi:uncharacterized protein (TIGR00725 family)
MKRSPIIGVMGGGISSRQETEAAYRLGGLIAKEGWILLNGGRRIGIMHASARGARENGGITVGILPQETCEEASEFIDIPIRTGLGIARNAINVLSSDVVVACTGGAGTLSEIAMALKSGRPVVLLDFDPGGAFEPYADCGLLHFASTPEVAVEKVRELLGNRRSEVGRRKSAKSKKLRRSED